MTQNILTLGSAVQAALPPSAPALPAPSAGLLPTSPTAAPQAFVDLFRALGLASPDVGGGEASTQRMDADVPEADSAAFDARLSSQSPLPAALHASSGVAEYEMGADEMQSGEAPALPVSALAVPLPLPSQPLPAAPAAGAGRALAPAAPAGGAAAVLPSLPTDGPRADVVETVQPVLQSAHGLQAAVLPSAPASAEAVLKLVPASPQSWQQPLTDALGERLQLQTVQHGERAVIRLDPPTLGRIEIIVQQDVGGALQVHLSASNGEVLRQLHAIGDSLRADLGQRHAQGDVTVVVAESGRDANGRDADGRSRSGQQQQGRDDENPGEALAEAQAGAGMSRFALATDGS
jgi:flagellar hook-length control protein FliK